jgi:membrane protease YdiL (CAAX protease family)
VSFEQDSEEKIKALLSKSGFLAFLINLTIVAVLPAIGEEFIFRGVIQNTLISTTRKPWVSILITATLFSAFHLMFEGFFARLFLGILLGYLYVVSKNIWLPILAHFANNAFQITMDYIGKLMGIEVSEFDDFKVHWTLALASLFLTILLCHYLYVFFRRQIPVQDPETS